MTDQRLPRFLVLTLHCGENEIDDCKASVARQNAVSAEQVVFSNLGNIEAHRTLYQEIMTRAGEFDFFLKLDADMVLSHDSALAEVAQYFAAHPGLDHLAVEVNDHFTGSRMASVHTFSPRVTWPLSANQTLFVDPSPQIPGTRAVHPADIAPFVEHAPNPHPFQAFHFGVHRALKIVQRNQFFKSVFRMKAQIDVLSDLERHYDATGRETLGIALMGATMVLRGEIHQDSGDKDSATVRAGFETVARMSAQDIRRDITASAGWRHREYGRLLSIGQRRQSVQPLVSPVVRRLRSSGVDLRKLHGLLIRGAK